MSLVRFISRITRYATVSTDDSVLIIGGFTSGSPTCLSTIAEYKDGNLNEVGDLAGRPYSHGSITSGSTTMIVGGQPIYGPK